MSLRIVAFSLLATVLSATAAPRTWKSADGSKSFQGEFVSREGPQISIKTADGKTATLAIAKLHPDDQQWLNAHHPAETVSTGVFDDLEFGDTREKAYAKLRKSQLVEPQAESNVFGSNSINGEFRLRQKIGDVPATLRLDWSEAGTLNGITLQTQALPAASYDVQLKHCWSELIDLMAAIHGPPSQSAPYPASAKISDGMIRGSHLWKLEKGGSAMLGTARSGDQYVVIVCFSRKSVEEIQKLPAPK